jgi:MFS superfamily sulfate permease-like transporter
MFPTLHGYRRSWLRADLVAGLTATHQRHRGGGGGLALWLAPALGYLPQAALAALVEGAAAMATTVMRTGLPPAGRPPSP